MVIGRHLGWKLTGPRRCIGVWSGTHRRACPAATLVPENGTDAQCPACATDDRGRALARDVAPDDGRTFALYLAWFGPGLIKVGLTAADRGRDRLLEQGAITATMLGTGPYTAVRRAERTIAAAGLAAERIGARAKANAWWNLPNGADRARQVIDARTEILDKAPLPPGIAAADCQVIDQAADFGLTQPVPNTYAELKAVTEAAVLTGTVRAIVGRRLLLDNPAGSLLIDMRRVAGWQLAPTGAETPTGLDLIRRDRPRDEHEDQQSLF